MQKGKKNNRRIISPIVIAILFGVLMIVTGCNSSTTSATDTNPPSDTMFESDSIVNQLLLSYNKNAEHLIKRENIRGGNIATKAIITIDTLYIEIVSVNRGFVHIRITENQEPTELLYDVFRDFIYAIDKRLTPAKIKIAWSDIQAESYSLNYPDAAYEKKSYELNGIQLSYWDYDSYGRREIALDILYKTNDPVENYMDDLAEDHETKEIRGEESSEPLPSESAIPEVSESEIVAIKAMMEEVAREYFKDARTYEIVYSEDSGFSLNKWIDGRYVQEMHSKIAGNDIGAIAGWDAIKELFVALSNTLSESASNLTEAPALVFVNLVNDKDTSLGFLSVLNGLAIYDVMEE